MKKSWRLISNKSLNDKFEKQIINYTKDKKQLDQKDKRTKRTMTKLKKLIYYKFKLKDEIENQ